MKTETPLELLELEIFVNEKYTGIEAEISYDILFDYELNQFVATRSLMNEEVPNNAPTEIRWNLTKKLTMPCLVDNFSNEEIDEILKYRGMNLKDGFFLGDVFMQGGFMEFVSKK